jgi:hypothetical protein
MVDKNDTDRTSSVAIAGKGDGTADYSTTFITFHPGGSRPYASSTWFHADAWSDVNAIEVHHRYEQVYDVVKADYDRTDPVKPVLMLEGSYEGVTINRANERIRVDARYVRVEAWHSYFAGGFYGYGHVDCYRQSDNLNYMDSVGSRQMALLAAFLKAREWWKFVPDEAIIASHPGSGAARKAAVKSTDGDECYVYFPGVSAAEIVMNRITAGSRVSVAWFDPRSGAVQPAGSYATSQSVSLTPPPDWEDAVLCLTAVGAE